jgi:hypothetical protein
MSNGWYFGYLVSFILLGSSLFVCYLGNFNTCLSNN